MMKWCNDKHNAKSNTVKMYQVNSSKENLKKWKGKQKGYSFL